MSLRVRLLATVAALLLIALLVSGFVVTRLTRSNLIDQVDERLRAAGPGLEPQPFGRRPGPDPSGRQLAVLIYGRDGQLLVANPSGFDADPDPLPDVEALVGDDAGPPRDVVTVPAVDGSLEYRVLVRPQRPGLVEALAAPLDGVDATVSSLVRTIALTGTAVLVGALGAGWWLVRRGLRPLESMAETAGEIAAGDLSHRVEVGAASGEVGRLATAFNVMLDNVQASFEAKEASEQRLRRFVADASHELRTPLTALRGYADLFRAGGLADEAELDRAMARIGTESRRMGSLVEDLLLLARLDQGRPLRRDPVDLTTLVTDAVTDARAIEPERPIALDAAPDVVALGDDDRLRQVVGNLLGNVRMHTPPGTPVEVSLAAANGSCRIAVADHGPGIAPADAEHVFDRFWRADAGRSRARGGTGLGLAIAASIVRAHGGAVTYRPTPGGGATFELELPQGGREPAREPVDAAAPARADLEAPAATRVPRETPR